MSPVFSSPAPVPMKRSDDAGGFDRPVSWTMERGRLTITGEIDQSTRATVRAGFVEALHDRDVTVIDLKRVTFFGATGVSLLIEFGLHERLVVVGNERIRQVLDICELPHLLSSVPQPA